MTTTDAPLKFTGVLAANLLPFTAGLSIDEGAYRAHLRWLVDAPGVTGVVVNGHAAEVASLSPGERQRALAIALDEVAGACPVVSGVYADGTQEAVALARDARAGGATGILVFPPTLFMWGAQLKPEMALRHFAEIASAVDLPIVIFEYPTASGIGYTPETLARLAEIPTVAAVKDWSNDIVAFEQNLRAVRATGRPVAVLSSFTMSLMASFLLGADGAISGMGSVVADLQAELFVACQKGDLERARGINDRLHPLVRAFYAPPFVDMHNRMKEALVLLGRIPRAHVRPPLTPVTAAERAEIRRALVASRLLPA
ncbi:MAG: dihydrodipicolinate synthase family protein [Candidatus Rokuibacteriota bacterium]|nr:MAG: dihydrodipicolinate synthase family protein [Candidatus Rokubacteria bacterium]